MSTTRTTTARRRLGAASAVGALVLLGAAAPVGAAAAAGPVPGGATAVSPMARATSISGFPSSLSSVAYLGELSNRVSVRPAAVRPVVVQYRSGSSGRVRVANRGTTNAAGLAWARFSPPKAGQWQYRLVVPAAPGFAAAATRWRTVFAYVKASETRLTVGAAAPAVPWVGASTSASVTVKEFNAIGRVVVAPKRTVELHVRGPADSALRPVASATSDARGKAVLRFTPRVPGTYRWSVYVRPSLAHQGIWLPARTVTVTLAPDLAPPDPVGLLQGASDGASVTLTWTTPSDNAGGSGVAAIVVRRALGPVPPATPSDGQAAAVLGPSATQLVDAPPSAGSWSYTVWARDLAGNLSLPSSVTGMGITGP